MNKVVSKPIKYHLSDDDLLYFLHIPKTAGTSFISILDSHYDNNYHKIYVPYDWKQLSQNIPADFSSYNLLRGHFGYGIHRLLSKKPIYLTMLRDPFETVISLYE